MSLSVKVRKVDSAVVLDLSGKLTIGEPVMLLRETLRSHADTHDSKIAILQSGPQRQAPLGG